MFYSSQFLPPAATHFASSACFRISFPNFRSLKLKKECILCRSPLLISSEDLEVSRTLQNIIEKKYPSVIYISDYFLVDKSKEGAGGGVGRGGREESK